MCYDCATACQYHSILASIDLLNTLGRLQAEKYSHAHTNAQIWQVAGKHSLQRSHKQTHMLKLRIFGR